MEVFTVSTPTYSVNCKANLESLQDEGREPLGVSQSQGLLKGNADLLTSCEIY
jgi:hypothetical protein